MTRTEAQTFYLWGAKTSVFAAFFAPLVLSGYFFFPFIVPKTIFFQIAVELALFFYLLLVTLDKKYLPKFDVLDKAVLAFFLVFILASALGADPARSFFGTYERMLSVMNFAHFIALYFIIRSLFVTTRDWIMLLRVFLVASACVSLYGIAQKFGFSSLVYHAGIDRIDATIGNAAFLAGYLMFTIFFALILFLKDADLRFRALYFTLIVIDLALIYFTGTRGAALALAGGVAVLGIAYFFRPKIAATQGNVSQTIQYFVFGAVLLAGVVFFMGTAENGAFQYLKRFTSISLSDATVQTRILSIGLGIEGMRERPLLGWGPENYNLVFDKYYNPKLYPTENWFDHAHNIFFDIGVTMGIAGLLAYAALLCWLLFLCVKYARAHHEQYWVGVLMFALTTAYFTQNVFVFDSMATYLPFFLLLAFAGNGFFRYREEHAREQEKHKKEKRFDNPSASVAIVLMPVFLAGMWFANVRPALAAHYAVAALMVNPAERAQDAMDYFKRSFAYAHFGNHEVRGKLADYTAQLLGNSAVTNEDLKKEFALLTVGEMERSLVEHPLDFRNYLYFANFLTTQSAKLTTYGVAALERADEVLARAEPLGQNKPILYIQWGRTKIAKGEYEASVRLFEKAIALSPEVPEPHLQLAGAYRRMNDMKKAQEKYRFILDTMQGKLGSREYVELAIGFANAGNKKDAIFSARKAMESDPSLKEESEDFIEKIEALPSHL